MSFLAAGGEGSEGDHQSQAADGGGGEGGDDRGTISISGEMVVAATLPLMARHMAPTCSDRRFMANQPLSY